MKSYQLYSTNNNNNNNNFIKLHRCTIRITERKYIAQNVFCNKGIITLTQKVFTLYVQKNSSAV